MTLTRFQIHERLGSLSGEVKAAHEQKRLTAETLAHQEREVTLARQADEKAEAQIVRLEQEALDLAAAYHETVKELIGITPGAAEAIPEPISPEGMAWAEREGERIVAELALSQCAGPSAYPADAVNFADFGHPTQNGLDDSAGTSAFDRSTHP